MTICSIEGCEKPVHGNGFCKTHDYRFVRYGDPLLSQRDHGSPVDKLWRNVRRGAPEECWEWIGRRDRNGYGHLNVGKRHRVLAHRLSAAIHFGMFDRRLNVLHRCDNPPCVNPSHLYLGTQLDNLRDASTRGRLANQRRTHCVQGHPYDEENLIVTKSGHRRCRECARQWSLAYYYRQKELTS